MCNNRLALQHFLNTELDMISVLTKENSQQTMASPNTW
ncbi:hypothetical protein Cs308_0938 [Candidatus Chlamydia sanziniae]|uniref:Uncharacterized protein n=1 Tax=Candidatus Chlamydia sanziniae TaxID=1806891 RepID=A0A1A9HVU2_9CHLA|nr:hypothetical protein Cs308_0938 [Candidatus Chlamydia sanziniae]